MYENSWPWNNCLHVVTVEFVITAILSLIGGCEGDALPTYFFRTENTAVRRMGTDTDGDKDRGG